MKLSVSYDKEKHIITIDFDTNFMLKDLLPYLNSLFKSPFKEGFIIYDSDLEILSPNCKIVELIIINPKKYKNLILKTKNHKIFESLENKSKPNSKSFYYFSKENNTKKSFEEKEAIKIDKIDRSPSISDLRKFDSFEHSRNRNSDISRKNSYTKSNISEYILNTPNKDLVSAANRLIEGNKITLGMSPDSKERSSNVNLDRFTSNEVVSIEDKLTRAFKRNKSRDNNSVNFESKSIYKDSYDNGKMNISKREVEKEEIKNSLREIEKRVEEVDKYIKNSEGKIKLNY